LVFIMADNKKEKTKKQFKEYKPGKQCPKCNSRMAEHADRFACGKCGYTEFKTKKSGV
jgi:ubiquitin-small subunit ribosomal protein S27Ae